MKSKGQEYHKPANVVEGGEERPETKTRTAAVAPPLLTRTDQSRLPHTDGSNNGYQMTGRRTPIIHYPSGRSLGCEKRFFVRPSQNHLPR